MNLLSWNWRGLGIPRTVHDLYLMVRDEKPTIVFLIEIKSNRRNVKDVKTRVGFEGCFVVDLVGKGGLDLLW